MHRKIDWEIIFDTLGTSTRSICFKFEARSQRVSTLGRNSLYSIEEIPSSVFYRSSFSSIPSTLRWLLL